MYITDADGDPAPGSGQNNGGTGAMLNLPDAMFIFSPLPSFMLLVGRPRESDELDEATGLKILTSKKVCCLLFPQKPMALMSCLALSPLMADRPEGCSTVKG